MRVSEPVHASVVVGAVLLMIAFALMNATGLMLGTMLGLLIWIAGREA